MRLTTPFALLLSTLASGLPLEGAPARHVAPRSKTYAIVNVDGGLSGASQQGATVVVDQTKTVQVTDAASTIISTDIVTVVPTTRPAPSKSSVRSSSRSASRISSSKSPISTPTPTMTTSLLETSKPSSTASTEGSLGTSLVTVTITEGPAPTEWYDNGLWHTRYPVKTKWS